MPVWVWILLGLTALGFALSRIELGADGAERFQKALAIFFVLAVVAGVVFGLIYRDWS